jgi:hypothetical protein
MNPACVADFLSGIMFHKNTKCWFFVSFNSVLCVFFAVLIAFLPSLMFWCDLDHMAIFPACARFRALRIPGPASGWVGFII